MHPTKLSRYCRCIKQPCDHAFKYHFTLDDPSSSSPGPLAVKCTLSEDHSRSTFTKKAKNTIISVGGQTLRSKSYTVVTDDKKVKVTAKGIVQLKQMEIGKILDHKLSIYDAAKDSVEDWAWNFSLSVILSGVNISISEAATVHVGRVAYSTFGGSGLVG